MACARCAAKNAELRPPHSAGGYSFSFVVSHWPEESTPIEAPRGRSCAVCHARRWCSRSGILRASSIVGLGDAAPQRPWARRTVLKSGHVSNMAISGSRHMDAFSSSSGIAGCSKMPWPPTNARWTSASTVKSSRRLPTPNCRSSRKLRESMPHSASRSRSTRGHLRPGTATPLAFDQVSQGGPAKREVTYPARMPWSQNWRVFTRLTSPQHASTTKSREMVRRTKPSSTALARSR